MTTPVTIIGGGPYSLSTAAFLRDAGVDVQLYGKVMGFWQTMPKGMILRSYYRASNIAGPRGSLSLPEYEERLGRTLTKPLALSDFIEYGRWFCEQSQLPVDPRLVSRLKATEKGFELSLEDGEVIEARCVVVATGIMPFPMTPEMFDGMNSGLVSHTSAHLEFAEFRGKRVLVVGAGQSALESAAFLSEAGASTELVVRRSGLRFLRGEKLYETGSVLSDVMYPSWGVGPPGVNWLMGRPSVFRRLPRSLRDPLARRAIRPAGAAWVRPRLEHVRVTTSTAIRAARPVGSELHVELDDGSERVVDHLLLGTGYRIDVRRYPFLDEGLVGRIRIKHGFPALSSTFEASVPGLFFVGAPAAGSAGPGMRFVSHTGFAAMGVTTGVLKRLRP
jgi:FAD-dependent urate hydroxylase